MPEEECLILVTFVTFRDLTLTLTRAYNVIYAYRVYSLAL